MNQTTFTRGPVFMRDQMLKENGEVMEKVGSMLCQHCKKPAFENPVDIQIITKQWGIAQIGSYDPKNEHDQHLANANLIVAAFNAATAAQDMGFDGIKAVEALPRIIEALTRFVELCPSSEGLGGHAPLAAFTISAELARLALAQAGQKGDKP